MRPYSSCVDQLAETFSDQLKDSVSLFFANCNLDYNQRLKVVNLLNAAHRENSLGYNAAHKAYDQAKQVID